MTENCQETVVVAMSGGVDSSVAAGLLQRQGYNVIGVTLLFRPCDDDLKVTWCCGTGAQEQARAVAGKLGIPFYAIDVADAFAERVLKPSWQEYAHGRTPSPCILCNEKLKFGLLLDRARALGATKVASGHYSRIERDGDLGAMVLRRGVYRQKDQAYFLFSLSKDQIEHTLFPLGGLTKAQVRELAAEMGFRNAGRPESQDACFSYEDGGFAEALRRRFDGAAIPGDIVDTSGKQLRPHDGIHNYTIGQRRGLRVALGKRAYVTKIDAGSGTVVLSDNPNDLLSSTLTAGNVTWTGGITPQLPLRCEAQIRYRHSPAAAVVDQLADGRVRVNFTEPQNAVAPGQAVVFFDGDRVVGGGWIESISSPGSLSRCKMSSVVTEREKIRKDISPRNKRF